MSTKPKQFTTDWFSHNIPNWEKWLATLMARPKAIVINVLEIGAWEGRATCWMLNNIPMAKVTCIDTFAPGNEVSSDAVSAAEALFNANTKEYGDRCRKVKGESGRELCVLVWSKDEYDFIYIDGSHMAPDVLTDAVLAWRILKPGGILIFDDYKWNRGGGEEKRPKVAIDSFLACFAGQYDIIHIGHQVALRKK